MVRAVKDLFSKVAKEEFANRKSKDVIEIGTYYFPLLVVVFEGVDGRDNKVEGGRLINNSKFNVSLDNYELYENALENAAEENISNLIPCKKIDITKLEIEVKQKQKKLEGIEREFEQRKGLLKNEMDRIEVNYDKRLNNAQNDFFESHKKLEEERKNKLQELRARRDSARDQSEREELNLQMDDEVDRYNSEVSGHEEHLYGVKNEKEYLIRNVRKKMDELEEEKADKVNSLINEIAGLSGLVNPTKIIDSYTLYFPKLFVLCKNKILVANLFTDGNLLNKTISVVRSIFNKDKIPMVDNSLTKYLSNNFNVSSLKELFGKEVAEETKEVVRKYKKGDKINMLKEWKV